MTQQAKIGLCLYIRLIVPKLVKFVILKYF